jgi:hypothetical protein
MNLREIHTALGLLLEGGDRDDEPVCLKAAGKYFEVESVSTVVSSDAWHQDTVVLDTIEIEEVYEEDG